MIRTNLAITAIAATLFACPGLAQAPSPGPKTVQMADEGLFDFDEGKEGDRQTADLRLNKSQDGTFFLEPLNGAGIGYLETAEKAAATCKSGKASLRASRINASTPEKGTQLCVRTSDDEAYILTLGDKSGNGLTIAQYTAVGNNSEAPPAAAQNRIVYKIRPLAGDTDPTPVATQASTSTLTLQTRMVFSNVMSEVESARLTCSMAGYLTANGMPISNSLGGYSDMVTLTGDDHRNSTKLVQTEIDLPPGLDLETVQLYSCSLILFIGFNDSGRPVPQSEVVDDGVEPWRGHRGDDGERPWGFSVEDFDLENAMYNRGGVVKTPDIRFNGMALPGMVATPVEPDEPESELPDVATQAGMLTEVLECPSAETVENNSNYRVAQNAAGWDIYERPSNTISGEYGYSETIGNIVMRQANLTDNSSRLECHYARFVRVDWSQQIRQPANPAQGRPFSYLENVFTYYAADEFGFSLSKTGDGACTPVDPAAWNESGTCFGRPADGYSPLCPSDNGAFENGECKSATRSSCAVECPKFPAGE